MVTTGCAEGVSPSVETPVELAVVVLPARRCLGRARQRSGRLGCRGHRRAVRGGGSRRGHASGVLRAGAIVVCALERRPERVGVAGCRDARTARRSPLPGASGDLIGACCGASGTRERRRGAVLRSAASGRGQGDGRRCRYGRGLRGRNRHDHWQHGRHCVGRDRHCHLVVGGSVQVGLGVSAARAVLVLVFVAVGRGSPAVGCSSGVLVGGVQRGLERLSVGRITGGPSVARLARLTHPSRRAGRRWRRVA